MMTEADARIVIDQLLREADWDILDKSQVSTEEPTADGRADYLLKNTRTHPLAVIEAKKFSVDPYSAKEQARDYAISLAAPFVILSNGHEHYLWDYADGDAHAILGLPTRVDLERRANLKIHRQGTLAQTLAVIPMPERFLFKGEQVDARPYQLECIEKADAALLAGRRRMLFEMATGTGKTLTIAMLMKRWFQAATISRVLFLADRIELAKQAKETFDDYLRDFPSTLLYGGRRSLEGQVVVGTLETIASQLGSGGFGHAYFDLVVTDECHRSIYGRHTATLGHFDAIHVGLTATPNPGELHQISDYERRLVKSTYMFYDCWDSARQEGRPTFSYRITDAIREHYLSPYRIYHAESVLTYEGATWEGDEILPGAWGKSAESEDRLKTIIDEYFAVEEQRPLPHPRKTIVFAVSEKQAIILERLFNQLLPDDACLRIAQQTNRSPGQVRQDFAKKITCYSNNGNPKPIIDQFKYDPLPIVAVSVDMLDTGYDHKEIENLVMLRPTNSAIKYAQMRGRGSRLCPRIGKTEFLIYDFVGNSKKFNDPGQNYHRPKIVGPRPGPLPPQPEPEPGPDPVPPPPPPPPRPPHEFTQIPLGSLDDSIRLRETITVGPEGLAIDRQTYQDKWAEKVHELEQSDPVIQRVFAGQDVTEDEWEDLQRRLNSPEYFFDEANLRRAFAQPTGSLADFIRWALGVFKFPSQEERVVKAFDAWVAEHSASMNLEKAQMLRLLKSRALAGEKIEMKLFSQPPFSLLGGRVRMEQLFGQKQLLDIVNELNELLIAA
ncbi:MAG: DEAD/DEAH box helicase family protein [Planctomycetes bacterium]|nr:DEAD/DEAH box helicase family protein [Planctomycetota bacterium]